MAAERFVLPSRDAWLEARKNHIGGSDAAACVGLSPYKDNVQLWEEKMGLTPTTAMMRGRSMAFQVRPSAA